MNHIIIENNTTGERYIIASFADWNEAVKVCDEINKHAIESVSYKVASFEVN